MKIRSSQYAILALLFATTAWGGLFHAGKVVLHSVDPFWFTAIRYALAASMLLVILRLGGPIQWAKTRGRRTGLFLYGVLGYGMFGILVFVGLSHSVPSHGAVIMSTIPISGLFAKWLFDRQPTPLWAWAVALLAIVGVVLVSHPWEGGAAGTQSTAYGDFIAFVGTLGWVAYTRAQAKFPGLSVVEYTGFTAIFAVPGLLAIALFATAAHWAALPSPAAVGQAGPAIAYIVVIGTVLAALAYNKGVRTLGVIHGVVFINFVPVSALLIGLVQRAQPAATELLGMGIVIGALLIQAGMMARIAAQAATPSAAAPAAAASSFRGRASALNKSA